MQESPPSLQKNPPSLPRHFHLIWMGRQFPFIYRLAVESLFQSNPGARITVHYADPPENADWRALGAKAELREIDWEALLKDLPQGEAIRRVYSRVSAGYPAGKSNILRYLILYREGGVYLDFDTLTVRDYAPLLALPGFIGEEIVFRCDDDRIAGKAGPEILPFGAAFGLSYALSRLNARWLGGLEPLEALDRLLRRAWGAPKLNNAVLACAPGNAFFGRALELLPQTDPFMRFSLGPMLMNRTFADLRAGLGNEAGPESGGEAAIPIRRLPPPYFYLIPPSQTFRFFEGPAPALPEETFSLHWCSSNHRALARSFSRADAEKAGPKAPLFHRLARAVLERGI